MSGVTPVDAYLAALPAAQRATLQRLRRAIRQAAPDAEEIISHRIPAYRQGRIIFFFAAFKAHYSLFPMTAAMRAFAPRLAKYEQSKGTVRIPWGTPPPIALVTAVVKFNVRNRARKPSP